MVKQNKENKNESTQSTLWMDNGASVEMEQAAFEKEIVKQLKRKPATEVMKIVASRATNRKAMEKVFSPDEIEDILLKKEDGDELTKEENRKLRDVYRKMKRFAKDLEANNNQRIIVVPSLLGDAKFYKVFEFSALYYVYRLADRMERSARMVPDTDHFVRMRYTASLVDIEKFIEQMERLENARYEVTEEGIYIFTLKKPLSDEEIGQLKMIEEQRKDKFHNVMRPKNIDPATYNQIMIAIRQIAPKARKLEKHYYYGVGEDMLKDLKRLLAGYLGYANGIIAKDEMVKTMIGATDGLFAGLAILTETNVWDYATAAMIGENINEIRVRMGKILKVKTLS